MNIHAAATTIDSIKSSLVALRMPRALEVLDATLRRIEQGEIDGIEALDQLLVEERTMRENRRVRTALTLARLTTVKSLAGFDFAFQPSLDKKRILALGRARLHRSHRGDPSARAARHRQDPSGISARRRGRQRPAEASTSPLWPTSSPRWPRPNAMACFVSASAICAGLHCSSSTRSDTCRSRQAAAICSSSSSTPATRRAR